MKAILLLLLVHGCHLANAGWMLKSDLLSGVTAGKVNYVTKEACEAVGPCLDVPASGDLSVYDIGTVQVDDETKPLYAAKSDVWVCDGDADCATKLAAKTCPSLKFINAEKTEVYCTSVTGYEQKDVEVLQENPTKVAAKLVEIEKGAQITSYETTGEARRKYGSKLISITTGYTAGLNLSQSDSLALAGSMSQIITFANLGRIDLAKAAIQAYVPDQYFTQAFKDLLLWDIQRNGY